MKRYFWKGLGTYRNYSEKVASLIDKETKLIVQEAYEEG